MELFDGPLYAWGILPLLIIVARVIDVSLGTIRIILVSRGMKLLAPALGFFEILVWLLAIRQVFQHLDNPVHMAAYALGFALGNYLGIVIENRLAMGKVVVRIVTARTAEGLVGVLRGEGFSVTVVDAEGAQGPVHILFSVINRSQLPWMTGKIAEYNPKAFYTVEDVRFASGGLFLPGRKLATTPSALEGARKLK